MEANRTRVHMLPTDEAENAILKFHNGGGLSYYAMEYFSKSYLNKLMAIPYHLYFTSDEELKNGDTYLDEEGNIGIYSYDDPNPFIQRKIIATTDPELLPYVDDSDDMKTDNRYVGLPQPSKAFIEKYCKVGGIDEVLVEYELNLDGTNAIDRSHYIPKVDDHNTITIHPIKDSFTKDELEQCTLDVVYQMMFRANVFPEDQKAKAKELINYWIKNKSWKIKIQ